jgi:integrase
MPARRLTDITLRRIKAAEKRQEIPDGLCPGLYLVVQAKTGNKSWAVRYRYQGRPKKLTLGNVEAIPLREARERARKAKEIVRAGRDPAAHQDEEPTVAAVIEKFSMLRLSQLKGGGEFRRHLDREIIPVLGARPLRSIRRQDVANLLDDIVKRGAPVAANRALTALQMMMNWAADRYLEGVNPIARMRKPAKEKPRQRWLNDDEIREVWPALDQVGWPYGAGLKLVLLTAQRPGEVARMRWADINLDAATWLQHADATKTEEAILVPLSSMALDIIRSLPRLPGPFVFPTHTGAPRRGLGPGGRAASKLAPGVAHWTPHDLRRTAATQLGKLRVPDEIVDRILNHALPRVRGTYNVHSYLNEKREALELLSGRLEQITRGHCTPRGRGVQPCTDR